MSREMMFGSSADLAEVNGLPTTPEGLWEAHEEADRAASSMAAASLEADLQAYSEANASEFSYRDDPGYELLEEVHSRSSQLLEAMREA